MHLILFGAPGVGKGTQAKLISKNFNIPQISTGEMLRDAVKDETDLGKKASLLMNQGKLVPDEIMLELIKERISHQDCETGFILDGFPRTIAQAKGLDKLFYELQLPDVICIEINVPDEEIINRLVSRRLCEQCGTDYNLITNPPPENMRCDKCGGNIIQRKDDSEETISNRLNVYLAQTAPLKEYYQRKGAFFSIDGLRSIEEVRDDIFGILK
ncbi:MAG: adenylate kinase [Calditrichae bacterium]|nr:adenylate kinase [Calditrichia bacterium]